MINEKGWCIALLCFAFAHIFISAVIFPGGLAPTDNYEQMRQIYGLIPVDSWHSVFVTALWRLIISMTSVAGLYVFKQILYFIAASMIAYSLVDRLNQRIIIVFLLLFSPQCMRGTLEMIKDSEAWVFLALSLAFFLVYVYRHPKISLLILANFFGVLVILCRHNTVSFMPALFILYAVGFACKTSISLRKSILLWGTGLFVLIILSTNFWNSPPMSQARHVFLEGTAPWDFAGIVYYQNSRKSIPDKFISPSFRKLSDAEFVWTVNYNHSWNSIVWFSRSPKGKDVLMAPFIRPDAEEYLQIILDNAGSYLRHRYGVTKVLLACKWHSQESFINAPSLMVARGGQEGWDNRVENVYVPFYGTKIYRWLIIYLKKCL
ncbi:MAG: hypothetical protein KAS17_06245, partial [Victivallaceae bacterium]|nr:hypothetical protein [Victivallaceae bacterium]